MLTHFRKTRQALLTLVTLGVLSTAGHAQNIVVKTGEKIAFLGDSITQQGASSPVGYVRLVIKGLEVNDVKADAITAGISGHKSNDMLARLDRDVISKKPDWMTLSCGVNDVWHGQRGVSLEDYKTNITKIVDTAQAAGIKVVLLTSTMISENQSAENNQKLIPYNDFLKTLAAEKKLPLADLNAAMQAEIAATAHKGNLLTTDGVHMNAQGNIMMAKGVLRTLGLNDAQLQKAHEAWLDIPRAVNVNITPLSIRQSNQLAAIAAKQNISVNDLLNAEFTKLIQTLLQQKN
jgi:lysophospholipase L1-like esterase